MKNNSNPTGRQGLHARDAIRRLAVAVVLLGAVLVGGLSPASASSKQQGYESWRVSWDLCTRTTTHTIFHQHKNGRWVKHVRTSVQHLTCPTFPTGLTRG